MFKGRVLKTKQMKYTSCTECFYIMFCPKIDRKIGSKMYEVTMDDAAIIGGAFGLPLNMENKFVLELL